MELILDYDDWKIYLDVKSDTYYAIVDNVPTKVVPVCALIYDINTDVDSECFDVLLKTFDSDFSGEQITDDKITYWLFKEI